MNPRALHAPGPDAVLWVAATLVVLMTLGLVVPVLATPAVMLAASAAALALRHATGNASHLPAITPRVAVAVAIAAGAVAILGWLAVQPRYIVA